MAHGVLVLDGHLSEGPSLANRLEDRVEPESELSPLVERDRALGLAPENAYAFATQNFSRKAVSQKIRDELALLLSKRKRKNENS